MRRLHLPALWYFIFVLQVYENDHDERVIKEANAKKDEEERDEEGRGFEEGETIPLKAAQLRR